MMMCADYESVSRLAVVNKTYAICCGCATMTDFLSRHTTDNSRSSYATATKETKARDAVGVLPVHCVGGLCCCSVRRYRRHNYEYS